VFQFWLKFEWNNGHLYEDTACFFTDSKVISQYLWQECLKSEFYKK